MKYILITVGFMMSATSALACQPMFYEFTGCGTIINENIQIIHNDPLPSTKVQRIPGNFEDYIFDTYPKGPIRRVLRGYPSITIPFMNTYHIWQQQPPTTYERLYNE